MLGSTRTSRSLALAAAISALFPVSGSAVYVNPDGLGQALIYPYYTVRSSGGSSFNTYVSVVNHTSDAKVVRVRFREALNARVAQGFNLYLSPNDVWTGAIVPLPSPEGAARIVSADVSCVNAPLDTTEPGLPGRTFQNFFYAGSNADGLGEGLDRAREGWIEMIEMATLTGASAAAVIHNASGTPANCAAVQGTPGLALTPPTGGLSGTVTLINVANGQDFGVNAEALAELSTQPFYRPPADPYPAFDAAEVTPVSVVTANGSVYRSVWPRGIDAVSAALMRATGEAEYVLDPATRSRSEIVVAFPTRQFYVSGTSAAAPFGPTPDDFLAATYFNREERANLADNCGGTPMLFCWTLWSGSLTAASLSNGAAHTLSPAGIFGSQARPVYAGPYPLRPPGDPLPLPGVAAFASGWLRFAFPGYGAPLFTSQPSSMRIDIATGQVAMGPHGYHGLPVLGFVARTFENGTLACGAATCQGNYGAAFPLKYSRSITAP